MAIAIRYPGSPQAADISGLLGGLDAIGAGLEDRRGRKAFDQYLGGLYPQGGQQGQQPMSLAALDQSQGVQRAPLPDVQDPASARVASAHAASGGPQQGAIAAYIRHAAQKRGIDPEIALKVAMSEGGVSDPTRQSEVVKDGQREQSYGPFQLYMGGGLGNEFQQATGLHPSDPGAWQKGIDFALDKAKEGGWGPWYGAAKAGIGERDGIIGDGQNRRSVGTLGANGRPMLQNSDGSVSTEESITVTDPQLNGGKPTNIPSIWNGQRLREGQAVAAAMQSGQRFPAFGSIDEAVQAAQARSSQLGVAVDAQMNGGAPQAPQMARGGSMLPPREVMAALFKSRETRPLAIELARSAQAAQQGDPEAALKLQKLQLEVQGLQRGEWKRGEDGVLFNSASGETRQPERGAGQQGFRFNGTSVEAQALNGMMDSGQLTPQEAQDLATGKVVTNPTDGSQIFFSGGQLVGRPAGGGPAQPLAQGGQPQQQGTGGNTLTGPKATAEQLNRVSKSKESIGTLGGLLTRYEELVKDGGISVVPGKEKDNLNTVRQAIMLQAKELFNLGVLNGPDLSLMEKMIYDPVVDVTKEGGLTNLPGQIWSGITGDAGDRASNSVNELRRLFEGIQKNVNASTPTASGQDGGSGEVIDWKDL